jgi:hypothetical protein
MSQSSYPSEPHHRPRMARCRALLIGVSGLLLGVSTPVLSRDDAFAGRPGLAEAESEPAAIAKCESLHASLAGFRPPQRRVDLWVSGQLTLVHSDGVLWYLAICSSPRIRVLCVTYSDNGMKLGESVTLRGAYRAVDDLHVVLDPCLASRT